MFGLDPGLSAILILLIILALLIIAFVRIMKDKTKNRGGFITTMASTYDLHNKDQRQAIQEIAEIKANKKMEEQRNSDTNPE